MRSVLRRSGSEAFAAIGALLMVGSAFLCGCGLDWNLGLWTPPEEEETSTPADSRIGSASSLSGAWGVAVKGDFVFVSDIGGDKVYKFDQTLAGQTDEKVWVVGGFGTGDLQFNDPSGVALDTAGNVYVADKGNGRVQKITTSSTFVRNIGEGTLADPVGVALDSVNNLYVSDETLNTVFVFDNGGNLINQWNGSETGASIFNRPQGVAVGRLNLQDHLYVVDLGNHQVKVFLTDGTFAFSFGSQGVGNGQFADPWGVAVDASGRIYVSDLTTDSVQQFDPDGSFLAKLTEPSDERGALRDPVGLATAPSYLYAAENGAKWVRAIPTEDFKPFQ